MRQELEAHRRMRACLCGIRHLDPIGVDRRIAEFDREIARLETMLTTAERGGIGPAIEIVPIGSLNVRAA